MNNKKPTWLKKGVYTGIRDRFGNEIKLGDYVKITIGKPNSGYEVIYDAGAFCFTGGQLATGGQINVCSFIKFRDELLTGQITGKVITESFQSFLEIVSPIVPQGTSVYYSKIGPPSGGIKR
jgi:hypothetical protein